MTDVGESAIGSDAIQVTNSVENKICIILYDRTEMSLLSDQF